MGPSATTDEMERSYKIGILEVQGAFLEHRVALQRASQCLANKISLELLEVRNPDQITSDLDGLIIPGGESTAISLFLNRNKMVEPLKEWILQEDHVTWGTCAGMILLSKVTENQKKGGQSSLGVLDTDVSRNFFGRQVQSFEADIKLTDASMREQTSSSTFPGVFIRAPAVVETLSPAVNVLATVHRPESDSDVVVAVKQGNIISTAFHPELTDNISWHLYFLKLVEEVRTRKNKS